MEVRDSWYFGEMSQSLPIYYYLFLLQAFIVSYIGILPLKVIECGLFA